MSRRASRMGPEAWAAVKLGASRRVQITRPRVILGDPAPSGRCVVCAVPMRSNGGIQRFCSRLCRRRRHNRRAA